jgi:type I restriction enzyme S subunit
MKWTVARLGDVTENLDNRRVPLNETQRNEIRGRGKYPYLGANNEVDRIDKFIFDEKILCVAEDGGSWGAREQCAYIVNGKCWVNNHAHVLKAKSSTNIEYVKYFLNHANLSGYITGTTRGKLTRAHLDSIVLPLPPLAEQKRIAAILDEADALRRKRREAIAKLDTLLQSVFSEMFGKNEGQRLPLSSCSEVVSGVTKGRKFGDKKTLLLPYIRVANVQDGFLDLTEIKTVEALPQDLKMYRLQKGDVLLTEGGDYDKLGRGAMWTGHIEDCIHQNHIFRVRVNRALLLPEYFEAYLQTSMVKQYFLGCAKRTTNLASINMTQLKSLPVLVPNLSDQELFTKRRTQILALKQRALATEQQSDKLFCSLQYQAFNSELIGNLAATPTAPCLTLDF